MEDKSIEKTKILGEQNNSDATIELLYNLGNEYLYGEKVALDYDKAKLYFAKAISLGDYKAKYAVGKMYYEGMGIKNDYEKAYNIFNELATQYNDRWSKYYLGQMYYVGQYVEKSFEKAYNIFNKLVTQYNDRWSKYYLGQMYYFGEYVEKNYEKAYNIFNELVNEHNDVDSKYYLGQMYYFGQYVEQDYEKAKNLFEQVSGCFEVDAEYYLGKIYESNNYGTVQNIEKTNEYFKKIEKDICITLIYYYLATSHLRKFTLNDLIAYDVNIIDSILSNMPDDHQASVYYKKWKLLPTDAYNDIAERLKVKLAKYKNIEKLVFEHITKDEDIEIIAELMVQ